MNPQTKVMPQGRVLQKENHSSTRSYHRLQTISSSISSCPNVMSPSMSLWNKSCQTWMSCHALVHRNRIDIHTAHHWFHSRRQVPKNRSTARYPCMSWILVFSFFELFIMVHYLCLEENFNQPKVVSNLGSLSFFLLTNNWK